VLVSHNALFSCVPEDTVIHGSTNSNHESYIGIRYNKLKLNSEGITTTVWSLGSKLAMSRCPCEGKRSTLTPGDWRPETRIWHMRMSARVHKRPPKRLGDSHRSANIPIREEQNILREVVTFTKGGSRRISVYVGSLNTFVIIWKKRRFPHAGY